jgi:hypothetical protein
VPSNRSIEKPSNSISKKYDQRFLLIKKNKTMKTFKQLLVPLVMTCCVILGISPYSIGQGSQTFSTPGTTSFVVPPGVTQVTIKAWGAGGGGGSAATVAQGGGGGGGFVQVTQSNVLFNQSCTVIVGAGGTAGNNGGASSCNSNPLAMGGQAGSNIGGFGGGAYGTGNLVPTGPNFSAPINFNGGDAGAATNPGSLYAGGGGGSNASASGAGSSGINGGTSPAYLGGAGGVPGGGNGGNQGANGVNAFSLGSGGGGKGAGAATISGSGYDGQVIFTWPCPVLTSISYPSPSVCSYSAALNPTILPATAIGGSFSCASLGAFLNTTTGVIATGAPQGTHVISYGWSPYGGCPAASVSFTLTIAPQAVVSLFSYSGPYCTNGASVSPNLTVSGVAGVFTSAAGLSLNSTNGSINPSASLPGSYIVTYTVAANGNCNAVVASANVTITALPVISTFAYPGDNTYCRDEGLQVPTLSATGAAGVFSSTAGLVINASTGEINPLSSAVGTYVVTYTIAAANGCAAVIATENVEILALPSASIAYSSASYCQVTPSVLPFIATAFEPVIISSVIGGPFSSAVFSASPAGLNIVASGANAGRINLNSAPGVYTVTYSFTGANGCVNTATKMVTIYARPTATLTTANMTTCSNIDPTIGGVVTANGPWVLTLSNGQTASGTGNGPWSIVVNTQLPGTTVVYAVASLVDANCSGNVGQDLTGAVTIIQRGLTAANIDGAANVYICTGQDANVLVELSGALSAPSPSYTGTFLIDVWNGSSFVPSSPAVLPWSVTFPVASGGNVVVPAGYLPNTTLSITKQYRVRWGTMVDANGCSSSPLTGFVYIFVAPNPQITVSPGPVADVCPGSNIVFNVSQTGSVVGALFNWVATDASGTILGQAFNVPFATGINTNLGLSCPSNTVVTFTISPIGPSPYNCGGASVTRVVNVRDVVKPVWSQTANFFDRTVECNSAAVAAAQALFPSATDNCDVDVSNIVKISGAFVPNAGCPQSGTYTNTWTVTDDCGNVSLVYTQVITVTDLTAPMLVGVIPSGSTNNNVCKANAPVPPTVAAIAALYTDNCGTVVVTLTTTDTGNDCAWSFTHTYTVKDNCGNTVAVSPVIVYSGADLTAPSIGSNVFPVGSANNNFCINNVNVGPTEAAIAALYTDNCGGLITVVKTSVVTGTDCAWTVVYTYSIKDKCNNEVLPKPTVTYTGGDKTAPSLSGSNVFPVGSANNNFCINNVNVGPTEAAIAALYADNCGGLITVVKTSVITGTDCAWTVVYTYSIKDKCNNEVLPKPTITYTGGDKTAPSLIGSNVFPVGSANNNFCINNVNVGPTEAAIAALYADNCGGLIAVVKTSVVTGTDCNWTVVYTYSIKDKCNNEILPKPTVTYTGGDKTPPTLNGVLPLGATGINGCIGSAPVGPTEAAIAALYSDNCGGAITVTKSGGPIGNNCNWTAAYTYIIKDKCNNALPNVVITYSGSDQSAPVITSVIPTQTLNTGAGVNCSGIVPDFRSLVTYTDCGVVTLTQLAPYAQGTPVYGYNGQVLIKIEARDACGNKDTISFLLLLKDLTPPVVLCKPITINLSAAGTASITPASINNGSYDNCTPLADLIYGISQSNFTCANVGVNSVKLYVTDLCGNIDSCIALVTVRDVTAPVISCWGDTTISKDALCTYVMQDLTFRVNKADACGIASVTQSIPVGAILAESITSIIVTLTVTDVNGNSSNCNFKITFVDVTAPVFTGCPANIIVNTGASSTTCSAPATWIAPTAADACTHCCVPQAITSNYNSGAIFPVGVTTVIYTAVDQSGNTSTCSFTVTVIDNTKPVVSGCPSGPVNVNTGAGAANCSATATWTEPTATDNCTPAASLVRTRSHAPGATFPVGTTVVTYTFTDAAGNVSNVCSFNVVVVDNTAPISVSCPANIVNPPINAAGCAASVVTPNAAFTDNCGVVKLVWVLTGATTGSSPLTGINNLGTYVFNQGATTVTYTASDAAGNTATCSYTVTVIKPLAATITSTGTVPQNSGTTTTVTFNVTGGTAPYTIVYNAPVGGYPLAGGLNTIVTNSSNSSTVGGNLNSLRTTIPQPINVVGVFTYTLVSVTDANGCVITPGTTSTVTVVPASFLRPDLTATITSPISSSFVQNQIKEGVIEVENVVPSPTTGQVQFRVSAPQNYILYMNDATTVSNGEAVDNAQFSVVLSGSGAFYTVTSLPGVVIGGSNTSGNLLKIGFKVKATGLSNNSGNVGVTLFNGTGGAAGSGDNNSANNQVVQIFLIN